MTRAEHGAHLLGKFRAAAAIAARAGFHEVTEWWLSAIAAFLLSGVVQAVFRVGRRGGKSSTLCLLAVVFAVWGLFDIPLGDVALVLIVSTKQEEAARRLTTIGSLLQVFGVKFTESADTIELRNTRGVLVRFEVAPCTSSGQRGGTVVFAFNDEVSSWLDSKTNANPASEVLGAQRPAQAGIPFALRVLSSSPRGSDDAHAKTFDLGDTEHQRAFYAPTWIARTALTEEETHALEPDERTWLREYKAIPQGSLSAAFNEEDVAALEKAPKFIEAIGGVRALVDANNGGGDAFTSCLVQWADERGSASRYLERDVYDGQGRVSARVFQYDTTTGAPLPDPAWLAARRVLCVSSILAFDGPTTRRLRAEGVVRTIARSGRDRGIRTFHGDQASAFFLDALFRQNGAHYEKKDWTNARKGQSVKRIRQLLRERSLIVEAGPERDALITELRAFQEKITPSGTIKFEARSGAHDDRVALLLNAAMLDADGDLPGSPIGGNRTRTDFKDTDFAFG